MQASLGFVLSMLMTWRAQLHAARRTDSPSNQTEQHRSQYERICAPVLETVAAYGGPAVPTVLAAIAGFAVAVAVRQGSSNAS